MQKTPMIINQKFIDKIKDLHELGLSQTDIKRKTKVANNVLVRISKSNFNYEKYKVILVIDRNKARTGIKDFYTACIKVFNEQGYRDFWDYLQTHNYFDVKDKIHPRAKELLAEVRNV